jgi:hypothetical protein
MSNQLLDFDSRSPTAEPTISQQSVSNTTKIALLDVSMVETSATADANAPAFEKKSLAKMRNEIELRLDEATRKDFTNTANTVMRLGNRQPKFVEPRRQKIRDIVMKNKQIIARYNEYAGAHAVMEKRVTYRLPIFMDFEGDKNIDQKSEIEERKEKGEARVAATEQLRPKRVTEQEQIEKPHPTQIKPVRFNTKDDIMGAEPTPDPSDVEMSNIDPALLMKVVGVHLRIHSPSDSATSYERLKTAHNNSKEAEPSFDSPSSAPTAHIHGNIPREPWSDSSTANHLYITPVTNPDAFPILRIQVVQAHFYPSTKITNMWTHRNIEGSVVQVVADMQDGPVNHFAIRSARIITALGLREGANDIINIYEEYFKIDETFSIHIFPGQGVRNLKTFVVGELQSARHAYPYWLDYRGSADPVRPPFAQEARALAVRLHRRAPDIWKEVDGYWQLEQGSGGRMYRENRLRYLGEDPICTETTRRLNKKVPTMWG